MTPKPMTSKSRKNKNSEKGFALLIAIFTLLLLTAIGAGMVAMTNTDTSISANFRDEQTAYFAAKAGIEEVRDRLRQGPAGTTPNTLMTNAYFSTSALPGAANGVLYITNPSTGDVVTPWVTNGAATVYPDDEICSELINTANPCSAGVPTGTWYVPAVGSSSSYEPTTGLRFPWKWVRITAKTNLTSSGTTASGSSLASVDGTVTDVNYRVCWTGSQEVAINAATYANCAAYPAIPTYLPVYVITAMAQTPSGSRRMVQAETAMTTFPSVPGPLVFDGANPVYSVPSSNAFGIDGTNYSAPGNANGPGGSCPAGQPNEYALGALGTSAVTTLQADADTKKPLNYTGLNNPLSQPASVGDVTSQLGSLATVQGLDAVVSSVTLVAGNEGNVYGSNPAGGITNPGTIANPQVNVVQGDITLGGNWQGAGILLVTGNLTFSGKFTYDGIILVIGKGSVTKNGSGGSMDGAMLVANLYSGTPPTYGSLLPTTSAPGIPVVNWNGGGNFQMNYDSCWSTAMSTQLAWRIVAMREIIR